jgi:PII-like signaling protein
VSAPLVKLTVYLGERDRADGRFATERIVGAFAAARLPVGLVLRGIGGFGIRHHLREDRQLTLSEDLPLVATGIGEPAAIDQVRRAVTGLGLDGLITLERAWPADAPPAGDGPVKLTLYVGRHDRHGGEPVHRRVVARLRAHGFPAAIVLLGVDGVLAGERQRARLLAANAAVPMMIVAVGSREALRGAAPDIARLMPDGRATVERVQLCRVGGAELAVPAPPPAAAAEQVWQQLLVFGEEATGKHVELVHALRRAGARGATVLRGVWGYPDGGAPQGDRLWQVRRRVPVVTVLADAPERVAHHYALTAGSGVVSSEYLPAFRASGPGASVEELELTDLRG